MFRHEGPPVQVVTRGSHLSVALALCIAAQFGVGIVGATAAAPPVAAVVVQVDHRLVAVPDLAELSLSEATALLAPLNLRLQLRAGPRSGAVTAQSPPAGTRVQPGEVVQATTSAQAPAQELVVVPELSGSTVAEARTLLADLGLGVAGSPSLGATIDDQNPEARARVPKGSLVAVTVLASTAETGQSAVILGWLVGLALVASILATFFAASQARARMRRRTREARPRLVAHPDPHPELRLTGGTPESPTVSLRVEQDLAPDLWMERRP